MKKQLHEKLETIRKELGQTVIVHIALSGKGQYDILGIECLGLESKKDKKKEVKKIEDMEELPERMRTYIG